MKVAERQVNLNSFYVRNRNTSTPYPNFIVYQTQSLLKSVTKTEKMSGQRGQPTAVDPAAINPGTEDSDADANLAVEDSTAAFAGIMQPFMESITASIATAIATASTNAANVAAAAATAVRTASRAVVSISSSIDLFENLSTDMNTREGKALWYTIARMPGAWPKSGVAVTVANTEALQDLIRDRVTSYGLDRSMDIPTTGTGAVESAPKTIGGKDYTNSNLGNFVSFLDNIHQVNLDYVRNFKGWYSGGPNLTLAISANMKIDPLDPNAIGNLGLVNCNKIYYANIA